MANDSKKFDACKQRNGNGVVKCANFADEIQTVMNVVNSDGFVQRIELCGGHVPSIIIYSDR